MAKDWWIKLEVGAWERDVNTLSLEAEGALLKLIFKLDCATDRGRCHFVFSSLAILFKTSAEKVKSIITELKENNILNIEIDGDRVFIESRRIVRSAEISAINGANATKKENKKGNRKETKTKSKRNSKELLTITNNSNSDFNSDSKSSSPDSAVSEIISHLNEIAGTSFQVTEAHAKHIRARLKEGMTVEDLKAINIVQTHNWKGTEWQKYLRPSTLYNSEKAGGYLSEAKRAMQTGIAPIKSGLSKIEERNARLQRSADELRQQARKQSMS